MASQRRRHSADCRVYGSWVHVVQVLNILISKAFACPAFKLRAWRPDSRCRMKVSSSR